MRVAQIIGTVTLNRCHPSYIGARLAAGRAAVAGRSDGQDGAGGRAAGRWDELGAGVGDKIAAGQGPEASSRSARKSSRWTPTTPPSWTASRPGQLAIQEVRGTTSACADSCRQIRQASRNATNLPKEP